MCASITDSQPPNRAPDPEFNTTVEHPAYTKNYPRVLFDEAHNNFHTTTGRYKPFVDLIGSDGYNVVPGRKLFAKPSLSTFKILVIANALGAEDMDEEGADRSAFTEEECDAVRDWVKGGGSLLLIADHAPFGGAAESLGKRFGVEMSKGYVFDPENYFKDSQDPTYSDLLPRKQTSVGPPDYAGTQRGRKNQSSLHFYRTVTQRSRRQLGTITIVTNRHGQARSRISNIRFGGRTGPGNCVQVR